MSAEMKEIDKDIKEEELFRERIEEFYWTVRRKMTHEFVTGKFIRDQLSLVHSDWESVHGRELVEIVWGPRCQVRQAECPTCVAWRLFDQRSALGQRECEPMLSEVLNAMEEKKNEQ